MWASGRANLVNVGWWAVLLGVFLSPTPMTADSVEGNDALSLTLREITGQLERFNSLYISKLERELSSSSARIASLEATVRSVADRAAAWDNIQNHMTVWTDQTRTMERKLDMLNRCHEKQESWESRLSAVDALNHKLIALDKKINAMTRLEFKVEQVSERAEEIGSTLSWVKKQMNSPEPPIVAEFAGRGMMRTMVNIEGKVDNLTRRLGHWPSHHPHTAYKRNRVQGSRSRIRPTVEPEPGIPYTQTNEGCSGTCVLGTRDTRLLQDMASKLDTVFDRLTDPDYDYDDYPASRSPRRATADQLRQRSVPLTVPIPNGEDDTYEDTEVEQLFTRFWKSIFAPVKKLKRRFRGFETQLAAVHRSCNESGSFTGLASEVSSAVQDSMTSLDRSLRQEREDTRSVLSDQSTAIHKVSQAVSSAAYVSEQVLGEVTGQFQSIQATIREGFDQMRSLIYQYCGQRTSHDDPYTPPQPPIIPETPVYIPPTFNPPTERTPIVVAPTSPYTRRADDPTGCADLAAQGNTRSGIYTFSEHGTLNANVQDYFSRFCEFEDGNGWTVIQRRGMFGTPYSNFTQNWATYKSGFGDMTREFWWGNDYIHRLTQEKEMMVRFDLWDFDGNYAYAEYQSFSVGDEADNYRLEVYGFRGNASDSFSAHNGYLFSTFDKDNDEAPECCPCAPAYGGGWWFYGCFESNLNGEYHTNPTENDYYRGLIWELWLGDYSLRAAQIRIRPTSIVTDDFLPPAPPPTPALYPTPDPDYPELPLRQA